jgi:hypothetical protein
MWTGIVALIGILGAGVARETVIPVAVGTIAGGLLFSPFTVLKARRTGSTWTRSVTEAIRSHGPFVAVGAVLILLSLWLGTPRSERLDPLASLLMAGGVGVVAVVLVCRLLEVGPFAPEAVDGKA